MIPFNMIVWTLDGDMKLTRGNEDYNLHFLNQVQFALAAVKLKN